MAWVDATYFSSRAKFSYLAWTFLLFLVQDLCYRFKTSPSSHVLRTCRTYASGKHFRRLEVCLPTSPTVTKSWKLRANNERRQWGGDEPVSKPRTLDVIWGSWRVFFGAGKLLAPRAPFVLWQQRPSTRRAIGLPQVKCAKRILQTLCFSQEFRPDNAPRFPNQRILLCQVVCCTKHPLNSPLVVPTLLVQLQG